MAKPRVKLAVIALTILLLIMGINALVAGGLTDAWYVNLKTFNTIGLWKNCTNNPENVLLCEKRNLFRFDKDNSQAYAFDIILAGLAISVGFAFISTVLTTCIFCCQNTFTDAWKVTVFINSVFSILAALIGIAMIVYNEYFGMDLYQEHKHGWSNLLAWSGAAELFFSAILSLVLICLLRDNSISHDDRTIMYGYEMK